MDPNRPGQEFTDHDLSGLIDAAPDAVIVVGADGLITYWNSGAQRIFGFEAHEALGANLDLIIPERLRERHWTAFHQAVAAGTSRYGASDLLAVPATTRDGRRISVEFTVAFVRHDDQVAYVGAILRDVTERRAADQELRRRLADLQPPPAGP